MKSPTQTTRQFLLGAFIAIIALTDTACKKEEPAQPSPVWQNTFTPRLENNNQRDTVFAKFTL